MSENRDTVPPTWYAGLEDAHRADIAAKGWDKLDGGAAAATIAKSYHELQKLHGALGAGDVVKLPGAADAPEAVKAFWTKLGAPVDAKGYDFNGLKFSDGSEFAQDFRDNVAAAAAKVNMPAGMVRAFMAEMIPHMESADATDAASQQAALEANRRALDQEWGAEGPRNRHIAARAMDTLKAATGLDVGAAVTGLEQTNGVGYVGVFKLFKAIGDMMGEGRFVQGQQAAGGQGHLSADEASTKLAALANDSAWVARWAAGGAQEIQQKSDLIKIIAGGAAR